MTIVLGAFNDNCFWVHSMTIVLGALNDNCLGAFNDNCFGCIQ